MPVKKIAKMRSLAKIGRANLSTKPISETKKLRPGVKIAIGLATIGAVGVATSRKKEKSK